MPDDYKTQAPSDLVGTVELHRVLAGYRRAYEQGQITWDELQRYEREAEQAHGWSTGSMGQRPTAV